MLEVQGWPSSSGKAFGMTQILGWPSSSRKLPKRVSRTLLPKKQNVFVDNPTGTVKVLIDLPKPSQRYVETNELLYSLERASFTLQPISIETGFVVLPSRFPAVKLSPVSEITRAWYRINQWHAKSRSEGESVSQEWISQPKSGSVSPRVDQSVQGWISQFKFRSVSPRVDQSVQGWIVWYKLGLTSSTLDWLIHPWTTPGLTGPRVDR